MDSTMLALQVLAIFLPPGLGGLSSVIRLGDYYYYDVTRFLLDRKFQVCPLVK